MHAEGKDVDLSGPSYKAKGENNQNIDGPLTWETNQLSNHDQGSFKRKNLFGFSFYPLDG